MELQLQQQQSQHKKPRCQKNGNCNCKGKIEKQSHKNENCNCNDLYSHKWENVTKNGIPAAAATATISKFERNRTITKYATATATIST